MSKNELMRQLCEDWMLSEYGRKFHDDDMNRYQKREYERLWNYLNIVYDYAEGTESIKNMKVK